jgi:hypothetical protein
MSDAEARIHEPKLVFVDDQNKILPPKKSPGRRSAEGHLVTTLSAAMPVSVHPVIAFPPFFATSTE